MIVWIAVVAILNSSCMMDRHLTYNPSFKEKKKTFVMHRMLTEISLPACIRCWNCIYTSKKLFFLNLMGPLLLLKPVEIEKIKATEMCMKHYIHFLCTSNWSHDHHHCGRCKVLYLATNVCSTKKKKRKCCVHAQLYLPCVFIL